MDLSTLRSHVVSVWSSVLNRSASTSSSSQSSSSPSQIQNSLPEIRDDTDFFDLGGDSLSGGQVVHELHRISVDLVTKFEGDRSQRDGEGDAGLDRFKAGSVPEPLTFADLYQAPTLSALVSLWSTRLKGLIEQRRLASEADMVRRLDAINLAPPAFDLEMSSNLNLPMINTTALADATTATSKQPLSIMRELFPHSTTSPVTDSTPPTTETQILLSHVVDLPSRPIRTGPLSVPVPSWKLNGAVTNSPASPTASPIQSPFDTSITNTSSPETNTHTENSGPLSFSQERIWFMEQLYGGNSSGSPFTSFHISRLFQLDGPLDLSSLQQSLHLLVERHEQLRTTFTTDPKTGRAIQTVLKADQFSINIDFTTLGPFPSNVDEVTRRTAEERAMIDWSANLDRRPFDLSQAPLVRCHVARLQGRGQRHVLFIMFHHIAMDGWSMGTVLNELGTIYRAVRAQYTSPTSSSDSFDLSTILPPLPAWSYIDFAAWNRELCSPLNPDPFILQQLQYWRDYLAGYETLNLLLDYPRSPLGPSWDGDVVRIHFTRSELASMKSLAKKNHTSLFVLLLSAFQLLLSKYAGQSDIVVGSSSACRHYPGARDVVGCFINPFACRYVFRTPEQTTFAEVLKENHAHTMASLQNQDAPFDQVVAAVEANESQRVIGMMKSAADGSPSSASPTTSSSPIATPSPTPSVSSVGSSPLPGGYAAPAAPMPMDLSKSPIFQVMLVLQNQNTRQGGLLEMGDVKAQLKSHKIQTNKMDLSLVVEERKSTSEKSESGEDDIGLDIQFEYNTALFLSQSIARLSSLFKYLLHQIVANSASGTVASYTLLSPAERSLLVDEFNSRNIRPEFLQTDTTIVEMIQQQVARTPNLPAVRLDEKRYTYTKLNQLSSQACNLIRTIFQQHYAPHLSDDIDVDGHPAVIDVDAALNGDGQIEPDMLIAICMPPCLEMFALILGILKTGAAYVPLDPNYPLERIQYMLSDSGAKMLITTQEMLNSLTQAPPVPTPQVTPSASSSTNVSPPPPIVAPAKLDIPILIVEDDWDELREQPMTCEPSRAGPHNLAYVIYTSGSTGLPKGVMIEHHTMCNMARYIYPQMDAGTSILQFASQSFDAAVAEWSSAFTHGACLCLTNGKEEKIGSGFIDTINKYQINIAIVSPSVLASIPPQPLPSVLYFVVAGEANTEAVLKGWRQYVPLENGYGPTEITVCATTFRYDDSHPACCIGGPQPNYRCYVLDESRQLVPVGVIGELYVGGAGVTRGYLNRPELTSERFIPDPFAPSESPYKRMYKTGDLVRWLPDGTLLYIGRNDHQVKIRGVRIELGEIEHALCQHPRVAQAVVLAKDMGVRGKQLVAYLVPKKSDSKDVVKESPPTTTNDVDGRPQVTSPPPTTTAPPLSLKSVKKHMVNSLPVHLRPTYYLVLPALPLNNSSKTDLLALAKLPVTDENTGQAQAQSGSPNSGGGNATANGGNSANVERSPMLGSLSHGNTPVLGSRTLGGHRNSIHQPSSGRSPYPSAFGVSVRPFSPPLAAKHRLGGAGTPGSIPSTPIHSGVSMNQMSHWRQQLMAAWCQVLNRSDIGASENFFEVGGHSLLAAQLHATFSPELKQHITMLNIFKYPTINSMLQFLKSKIGGAAGGPSTPMLAPASITNPPSPAGSPALASQQQSRRPSGSSGVTTGANGSPTVIGSPPVGRTMLVGDDEPMAIIGMAGRFPGANSVKDLWSNLCAGKESIRFYTAEELEAAGVSPELLSQPSYVRAMGVMDDVFGFDAGFFHISNREADSMDPQQRIFLETAWTALEDAGYCPSPDQDPEVSAHAPRIGVFAGCGQNTYLSDYAALQFSHLSPAQRHSLMIVNEKDFLSSRVSYKLNLRGPAVVVQTACSTSLVAVHMACEALKRGECEMALAGGVSLGMLRPTGYLYQEGMILSPDGHCKAFSDDACGTVRGQGSGAVVLKRLSAALADGDLIYAVLKGSAINNDGSHKVSYSAPSAAGQVEVIRSALYAADVHPRTIGFVEAHGTGTQLGDPIEVSALTQAYREFTFDKQYAAMGSLKTNVGHLDAAAGVAGLIKAALALHHHTVPPTLHFKRPNPQLELDSSPFYVATALQTFPATLPIGASLDLISPTSPRPMSQSQDSDDSDDDSSHDDASNDGATVYPPRAAVSSFGIGGTNAHAILEAAPPPLPIEDDEDCDPPSENDEHPIFMLCWSAVSEQASKMYARNLKSYLAAHPETDLKEVAYTLQMHRAQFPIRKYVLVATMADALTSLESATFQTSVPTVTTSSPSTSQQVPPSQMLSPRSISARRPLGLGISIANSAVENAASTKSPTPVGLLPDAVTAASDGKDAVVSPTSITSPPQAIEAPKTPTPTPTLPLNANSNSGSRGSQPRSVVFLFPGQGSQFMGMGMELYTYEPVFRSYVQECMTVLQTILPSQFANITVADLWQSDKMNQTAYTQPALFVLEYSLAQMLISFGVKPAAMLGHSLGQYVAACVSGVFTLVDCLKAILARSQLMQELVPTGTGAMLSVRMGEDEFLSKYPASAYPDISIAASNSPIHITLAGPTASIHKMKEQLASDGQHCTLLATSHAFHSPMLDPMVSTYAEALGQLTFNEPTIPLLCNVTGGWMDSASCQTSQYWIDHLRKKVCFTQSVRTLIRASSSKVGRGAVGGGGSRGVSHGAGEEPPVRLHQPIFVEIGPGDTCLTLLKRHAPLVATIHSHLPPLPLPSSSTSDSSNFARHSTAIPAPQLAPIDLTGMTLLPKPKPGLVPSIFDQYPSLAHLLLKTGELWQSGVSIQWSQFYARRHPRVRLPTYPFQHVHHVIGPESPLMKSMSAHAARTGSGRGSSAGSPILRSVGANSQPSSPRSEMRFERGLPSPSASSRAKEQLATPVVSTFQPQPKHRRKTSQDMRQLPPSIPPTPSLSSTAQPKIKVVDSMTVSVDLSHMTKHVRKQSDLIAVALTSPVPEPTPLGTYEQVLHTAIKVFGVSLGMDPASIGHHDDFFNMGGDSLLAIQVLSELRKTFNVALPGSMLMSYPTPAGVAKQISNILDAQNGTVSMDTSRVDHLQPIPSASSTPLDLTPVPISPSPITPTTDYPLSNVATPQRDREQLLSPVNEDEPTSSKSVTSPPIVTRQVNAGSSSSAIAAKPFARRKPVTLALDASLTLVQAGNVDEGVDLVPLYMVHPIGGELYYYRDLAPLLGLNRPVYGFRAVSLDGRKEPFGDIRSMAKAYVEELLDQRRRSLAESKGTILPSSAPRSMEFTDAEKVEIGPILVGGVSFGGTVAYEMALMLSSMGFNVPLLVLVDSPAPGGLPARLGDVAGVLEYIAGSHMGVTADQLREMSSSQHTDVVTAARTRSSRRLPSYITDSLIKTWLAHEKAMFSYIPPTAEMISQFTGEVIFFRPTDALKHTHLNMHLPWIELVPQGVRICRVPGTHISMNSKQLIHNWANPLRKVLDQIDPIRKL